MYIWYNNSSKLKLSSSHHPLGGHFVTYHREGQAIFFPYVKLLIILPLFYSQNVVIHSMGIAIWHTKGSTCLPHPQVLDGFLFLQYFHIEEALFLCTQNFSQANSLFLILYFCCHNSNTPTHPVAYVTLTSSRFL